MNNDNKDYYEVLQVREDASNEVINGAYKHLINKYHPDKNNDSVESIEKSTLITVAYQTLSDSKKREQYDCTLRKCQSNTHESDTTQTTNNDDVVNYEPISSFNKVMNIIISINSFIKPYNKFIMPVILFPLALYTPFFFLRFGTGFVESLVSFNFGFLIAVIVFYWARSFLPNAKKDKRKKRIFDSGYLWHSYHDGDIKNAYENYLNSDHRFDDDAGEAVLQNFSNKVSGKEEKKIFLEGYIKAAKQEDAHSERRWSEYNNHKVSCRKCDDYAYPVIGAKRHYECDCGNRFFGPRHPF